MRKMWISGVMAFYSIITFAETPKDDLVGRVIIDIFQRQNTALVCLGKGSSLDDIRSAIAPQLTNVNLDDSSSINTIAKVIYTTFPCPFAPTRAELRPAVAKDIEGAWIFPEFSQKLRHGPKSPAWQNRPGMPPVKCEGVAYFADGEARVMQILGAFNCPTAKDLDGMREMPKTSEWKFIRDGRLQMRRADFPGHIEEWDVFVVEAPFEFGKISFKAGDLVEYLRRDQSNDFNAATVFRHLQRLNP